MPKLAVSFLQCLLLDISAFLGIPRLTNVCCQLKLCAARQMGLVGWVLGVCIIDRACTLCNHNRQVFPKIPRSAGERLLFWCLPALGRSMDRTILWCCSWSNVAWVSLVCTKLFRSTCCFDTAKILFAAQSIFNHMQQRICGVKYSKHNVTSQNIYLLTYMKSNEMEGAM